MILRDTSTGHQYVLRRRPGETLATYLDRERKFELLAKATLVVNDPTFVDRELDRVDDLVSVRAILERWSAGRLADGQAEQLLELDDEDDLYEIAIQNGVTPPDWSFET